MTILDGALTEAQSYT